MWEEDYEEYKLRQVKIAEGCATFVLLVGIMIVLSVVFGLSLIIGPS